MDQSIKNPQLGGIKALTGCDKGPVEFSGAWFYSIGQLYETYHSNDMFNPLYFCTVISVYCATVV